MKSVAILDIGSNSVQLLVAEVVGRGWRQVTCAEQVTRLAAGLIPGSAFQQHARERTFAAVVLLATRARALGVQRAWATGTRAFRVAADAGEFAARIEAATGVPIEIISSEREARLGFQGAVRGIGAEKDRILSVDVGGGSTEVVCGEHGSIADQASIPIGAVMLTERFLHHDPPTDEEVARLRDATAHELRRASPIGRYVKGAGEPGIIIGMGGTATTVGAMMARVDIYRSEAVHGRRVARVALRDLGASLAARSVSARRRVPGLDPARAETVLAGLVVIEALLDAAGAAEMTVSDHGMRHGLLRERIDDLWAERETSVPATR